MPVNRKLLGEIAHIYVGLPTKISDTRETGRLGNVLTVRSLTGTGIARDELAIVDFDGRDIQKYQVAAGDVVLSARSTGLKAAIVPDELDGTIINATLLGVRCLPSLEPRVLVAWLSHPEGRVALENISQSATLQMNITVTGLSKLEIPVPPLEAQRQMATLLETADEAYVAAVASAENRLRLAREVVITQLTEAGSP